MEFIRHPREVVGQAITDMKNGTYAFMDLTGYMDEVEGMFDLSLHLDRFHQLRFIDGKIERYGISSIIIERCIDRVFAKSAERPPIGLVTGSDKDTLTIVSENGLQTVTDLQGAVSATMRESVYEETEELEHLAIHDPTHPLSFVWRQFQTFCEIYNSFKTQENKASPEDHLLTGGYLGSEYMSFMVGTVPLLFQEEKFQHMHYDLQVTPDVLGKTLENSLARNIPIPAGDGISFDFINANTTDRLHNRFKLDTVHLEPFQDEWVVVFNDEVLESRKEALKDAQSHPRNSPHKDSLVLTCIANHTELPSEGESVLSTMTKMKDLFSRVGLLMYQKGFRGDQEIIE